MWRETCKMKTLIIKIFFLVHQKKKTKRKWTFFFELYSLSRYRLRNILWNVLLYNTIAISWMTIKYYKFLISSTSNYAPLKAEMASLRSNKLHLIPTQINNLNNPSLESIKKVIKTVWRLSIIHIRIVWLAPTRTYKCIYVSMCERECVCVHQ